MKHKIFAWCSLCCLTLFSCQENNIPDNDSTENSYFLLLENELRLENNSKDTLHLHPSFNLLSVTSQIRSEDKISSHKEFPFFIDTIYKEKDNEYAVVFADCGTKEVYNHPIILSFYRNGETTPFSETDTLHVYKRFFTDLPVVYIQTPNQVEITSKEEWTEDTELKIYDEKGKTAYSGITEIKGRGNSTWTYPKKPYALKLNKKAEILGMPEHKRWVLLANYLDKTLMRNHIAFSLAQSKGISLDWTPRGRFVDVVLNQKHMGTYYLCEQIKIDENRVNIHENNKEDIDGGFLIELDTNFDEVNKFHSTTSHLPVMVKEPDEEDLTVDQFDFLQKYINQIDQMLYSPQFPENVEYANYLDLNTFIDYYFIYELTGNAELGWPKSCYMHKDKGSKLKAGPVWDFDYATFGPFYNYFRQDPSMTNLWWFKQLAQAPNIKQLRKKRWDSLYPSFLTIFDEIDRTQKLIGKSAEHNATLWPINQYDINKDEKLTFNEAVKLLRDNLQEQIQWMNQHMEQ